MSDESQPTRLVVYGHAYCLQAQLLKRELNKREVIYEWRDIVKGDPVYQEDLKKLARGYLSVPTVIFEDGTVMVEPGLKQVLTKLGFVDEGKLGFLSRLLGAK